MQEKVSIQSKQNGKEIKEKKERPKYLSYEDIVFPSHQSSLSQLHLNNTQENTKEHNTNVLSYDTSNQQKDVDEDSPGTEEPKTPKDLKKMKLEQNGKEMKRK